MEVKGTGFNPNNISTNKPALKKAEKPLIIADSVNLNGSKDKNKTADVSQIRKMASLVLKGNNDKPLWSFTAPEDTIGIEGVFTSKDGSCYTSANSCIYKLDPKSGNVVWQKKVADTYIDTKPVVEGKDGTLYATTDTEHLISIDPGDGNIKSDIEMEGRCTPHFTPSGDLYLSSFKNFNIVNKEGKRLFKVPVNSDNVYIESLDSEGNALIHSEDGNYSISPDGKVNWKNNDNNISYFPTEPSKAYATTDDKVSAIDSKTGKELWSKEGFLPRVVAATDNQTFINFDGQLKCFDSTKGDQLWELKTDCGNPSFHAGHDGEILVEEYEKMYLLNPETGEPKWEMEFPDSENSGIVSVKAAKNGKLFVSFGKLIYGIDPQTGKKTNEYKSDDVTWDMKYDNTTGNLYIRDGRTITAYDALSPDERLERNDMPVEDGKEVLVEDEYVEIGGVKLKKNKK